MSGPCVSPDFLATTSACSSLNPTCWLVFQWPPSPPNYRRHWAAKFGSQQDPPGRTPSRFGERPEPLLV